MRRLVLVLGFLVLLVFGGEGVLGATTSATIGSTFPDPNLRKEVCLILGKSESETIGSVDTARFTSLMLKNKGIADATGIEVFSNLISLDLSGNVLKDLPEGIGSLKSLRILGLNNNQLRELPVELGTLEHLEVLSLTGNALTSLPVEIGGLVSLEQLNLKSNKLSALPVTLGKLVALEVLVLEDNVLTALPEGVGRLDHLSILDLGHNQLRELPSWMGDLSSLYFLDLSHNAIASIDEGAFRYVGGLQGCYLFNQGYQGTLSAKGTLGKDYALEALDVQRLELGLTRSYWLKGPDGVEREIFPTLENRSLILGGDLLQGEGAYTLRTVLSGGPANSLGDDRFNQIGSVYEQTFNVGTEEVLPSFQGMVWVLVNGVGILVGLLLWVLVRIWRRRSTW